MSIYYKYDENGNFIEPVKERGPNCTDIPLPEPNWKPVFDKTQNKWVETAPEEPQPPIETPSELDIVKKQLADLGFELMMKGVI